MLDRSWRDDGVAFYVPAAAAAGTVTVSKVVAGNAPLYVTPGAEQTQRERNGAVSPAFSVFTAPADGLVPLMRVHYENSCGRSHDELVAGIARFEKAYRQGAQPVAELHMSGVTQPTTLVVEAVDKLCPYQGTLSATSRAATTDQNISYAPFLTLEQMRSASATAEVFVGGQGSATAVPRAIARSCVKIAPSPLPAMDWRYTGEHEQFAPERSTGFQTWSTSSPNLDVTFYTVGTNIWSIGTVLGELRTVMGDWAADVGGKVRIAPKMTGLMAPDSFLHVTMEVDTTSTDRRYPQILISDQPTPVQENMAAGNTIIAQVRHGISFPTNAELQLCNRRMWEVNDQCPGWNLNRLTDGVRQFLAPVPEMNGLQGQDRTVRFDVYASTKRVYLFTNGKPYGCGELPTGAFTPGTATITFGDVLYHSAADLIPAVSTPSWYPFHVDKMQYITARHFSNLGFKSGTSAPSWNETRMPCVAASRLAVQD
jgi:hypothetical protein